MAIRWGEKLAENLGAPGVVATADILTSEKKPTWNRPVGCILAAVGQALALFGIGGGFVEKMGVAATPWAMESVYLWIKEGTQPVAAGGGTRLEMQRLQQLRARGKEPGGGIGRYPAPARNPEFAGVRVD